MASSLPSGLNANRERRAGVVQHHRLGAQVLPVVDLDQAGRAARRGYWPFGLNATAKRSRSGGSEDDWRLGGSRQSQIAAVPSKFAVARCWPSGSKATVFTAPPVDGRSTGSVSGWVRSHTRTVWSAPEVASSAPFGLKRDAGHRVGVAEQQDRRLAGTRQFHILAIRSVLETPSVLPSELNAYAGRGAGQREHDRQRGGLVPVEHRRGAVTARGGDVRAVGAERDAEHLPVEVEAGEGDGWVRQAHTDAVPLVLPTTSSVP